MLTPCEAASLRYVHDVLTGDFVTIGVVLYSRDRLFLGARVTATFDRVKGAFPDADAVHLRRVGVALQDMCEEWQRRAVGELRLDTPQDLAGFLRMLVPPEDAALQFSPIISGVTADPQRTLDELFERYVGKRIERRAYEPRSEPEIWRDFTRRLPIPALAKQLKPRVVKVPHYEWEFRHAWKNGTWHAIQPLSLDLVDPQSIKEKAVAWSGRLSTLRPRDHELEVKMLVAVPPRNRPRPVRDAARDALAILSDNAADQAEMVPEDHSERLARQVVEDLSAG